MPFNLWMVGGVLARAIETDRDSDSESERGRDAEASKGPQREVFLECRRHALGSFKASTWAWVVQGWGHRPKYLLHCRDAWARGHATSCVQTNARPGGLQYEP